MNPKRNTHSQTTHYKTAWNVLLLHSHVVHLQIFWRKTPCLLTFHFSLLSCVFHVRVVWGFLSQCSFHLKDRIVSVFNAVQPKSTKITGTQYWFSGLSFAHRDFSKVFMILGAVDDDKFKVVTMLRRRTVKDFPQFIQVLCRQVSEILLYPMLSLTC